MAAATADVDTPRRYVERVSDHPVLNAVTIFNGTIVMKLTTNANARPGADTANGVVLGIAEQQVVNSGAAGSKRIRVRKGVFKIANGGSFTEADVGNVNVYVQDDKTGTTAAAATNDVLIGPLEGVDSDGIWVAIGL